MKRISALVCLILMLAAVLAPAAFAEESATAGKSALTIESSIPHDGDEGVSVENLSVKIYFSKEMMPANASVKKANAKAFKLTDKKGNKIPIKVYYSEEEREDGLLMVVSDNIDNKVTIEGDTQYILTISPKLQATDGTRLGTEEVIKFKTLDQGKSTLVYTILMVIMMVGMVVFTSRSAKKAMEKENEASGKSETVNPYKEAKRTGKSVEEIVEKDRQRKAKEAEALAKRRAIEAELEDDEEEDESSNKRVSKPRPISAAGSTYRVKVVKTQKPQQKGKGSNNSKNQSGKQKGSKNRKKKK